MGDAEISIHARDLRIAFVPRLAADQLGEKIQQVVQDHETQSQRDQHEVGPANPLDCGMRWAGRNADVYRTDDEMISRTGVTVAAGLGKVGCIHG